MAVNIQGQLEILGIDINSQQINATLNKAFSNIRGIATLQNQLNELGKDTTAVDNAINALTGSFGTFNSKINLTKVRQETEKLSKAILGVDDLIKRAFNDGISASQIESELRGLASSVTGVGGQAKSTREILSSLREEFNSGLNRALKDNVNQNIKAQQEEKKRADELKKTQDRIREAAIAQERLNKANQEAATRASNIGGFEARSDQIVRADTINREVEKVEQAFTSLRARASSITDEIRKVPIGLEQTQAETLKAVDDATRLEARFVATQRVIERLGGESDLGFNLEELSRDFDQLETKLQRQINQERQRLDVQKEQSKNLEEQNRLRARQGEAQEVIGGVSARGEIDASAGRLNTEINNVVEAQLRLRSGLREVNQLISQGAVQFTQQEREVLNVAAQLSRVEARSIAIQRLNSQSGGTPVDFNVEQTVRNFDVLLDRTNELVTQREALVRQTQLQTEVEQQQASIQGRQDIFNNAVDNVEGNVKFQQQLQREIKKVETAQRLVNRELETTETNIRRGNIRLNEQEREALEVAKAFGRANAELLAQNRIANRSGATVDRSQLYSDDDIDRIKRGTKEVQKSSTQVANARLTVENFGKSAALAFKRYSAFLFGSSLILPLINNIGSATRAAIELEQSFTKIEQVLNGDLQNATVNLRDDIRGLASELGVAADELAEGVFFFAQSGVQELEDLSEIADQLAKIPLSATFDDIQSTSEGLIAVFGQFNKEASETGEILDVINQFSADFAAESSDIFEAVKRGGAAFAVAGGQFEEFVALFSVLRESTRESAETLGTFFKSGFAQILQPSSQQQLRQLGVEADNVVDQLTELSNILVGPNSAFSEIEQINIARQLTGQRQFARLLALLRELQDPSTQNRVDNALDNSGGSLDASLTRRLDDVGTSINRVRESFNRLFSEIIEDPAIQQLVGNIASLITGILSLTEVIKPLLVGLAALGASKGISVLGQLSGTLLGARGGSNVLANNFARDLTGGNLSGRFRQPNAFLTRESLDTNGVIVANALSNQRQRRLDSVNRRRVSRQRLRRFGGRFGAGAFGAVAGLGFAGSGFLPDQQASTFRNVLSGGLIGAGVGTAFGGPAGAAIGGAIGTAAAALSELKKAVEENTNAQQLERGEAIGALTNEIIRSRKDDFQFDRSFLDTTLFNNQELAKQTQRDFELISRSPDGAVGRANTVASIASQRIGKDTAKFLQDPENVEFINSLTRGIDAGIVPQVRARLEEQLAKDAQGDQIISSATGDELNIQTLFFDRIVREVDSIFREQGVQFDLEFLEELVRDNIEFRPIKIDLDPLFTQTIKPFVEALSVGTQQISAELNSFSTLSDRFALSLQILGSIGNDLFSGITGTREQVLAQFGDIPNAFDDLITETSRSLGELAASNRAGLVNIVETQTGAGEDVTGGITTANNVGQFIERLAGDAEGAQKRLFQQYGSALQFLIDNGIDLTEFADTLVNADNIEAALREEIGDAFAGLIEFNQRVVAQVAEEINVRRSLTQSIIGFSNTIIGLESQIRDIDFSIAELSISPRDSELSQLQQRTALAVQRRDDGRLTSGDVTSIVSAVGNQVEQTLALRGSFAATLQTDGGGFSNIDQLAEAGESAIRLDAALTAVDFALTDISGRIQDAARVVDLATQELSAYEQGIQSAGQAAQGFTLDTLRDSLDAFAIFASNAQQSGGIGSVSGVTAGVEALNEGQFDNLTAALNALSGVQIAPGITGADITGDINEQLGIALAAQFRSALSGRSTQDEQRLIAQEIEKLRQNEETALQEQRQLLNDQRSLIDLQREVAILQREALVRQLSSLEGLSDAAREAIANTAGTLQNTIGSTAAGDTSQVALAQSLEKFDATAQRIETAINVLNENSVQSTLEVQPLQVNVAITAAPGVVQTLGSVLKQEITSAIGIKLSEVFQDDQEKASQLAGLGS